MIKIIQNLKSWSKEKLSTDCNVILMRKFQKFIIVWVTLVSILTSSPTNYMNDCQNWYYKPIHEGHMSNACILQKDYVPCQVSFFSI
jgi:hypothetical protein